MTKKEQAAVDAEMRQLRMMAAMRWTEPYARDVPPPKSNGETVGWYANGNRDWQWVERAWSSSIHHGTFYADGKKSHASQNPTWLYSTKSKALRAARHEAVIEAAKKLMWIDKSIAEAEAEEAELFDCEIETEDANG